MFLRNQFFFNYLEMANLYDEVNVCEHQYSGCINPLSEDNLMLEEEARSSVPLLGNNDEPATFCVRCRSMSNSCRYVTNHESELRNPVGLTEWGNRNIFTHECNGCHDTVFNNSLAPQYLITSTGDGADMPLLTDRVSIQHILGECHKQSVSEYHILVHGQLWVGW
jgi:hypothetical protein